MIHAFSSIALCQFISDQPRHHRPNPLLADDGVTDIMQLDGILEVDALVRRRDGWLLGQKSLGLWSWHGGRGWIFAVECWTRKLDGAEQHGGMG